MPSYPITAPDGTRYIVNAPEGATAEDALRFAKAQLLQQQEPEVPEEVETPDQRMQAYLQQINAPIDAWAKTAPIERGFGGNFGAALSRSTTGLGSAITDQIPAAFYTAIGDEEAAKEQLAEAKAKQQEAARLNPAQFDKVEDVKLGQTGPFLGEKIGEALPSTGAQIGLMAAAVPVAMALGAPAAAATGIAMAAGYLGSFFLSAPDELQNLYEKTGKLDLTAAVISGGLQAALDILPEIRLAGALTGPLKAEVTKKLLAKSGMEPSLIRSVAKETGLAVAGEGLTGGAQTAISIAAEKIVGENNDLWGSEEFSRILNGAVSEAAGGLAFGPVAGAVGHGREVSEKNRIDEEARVKQEAEDKQNRLAALQGSDEQPGLIAQQQQKITALESDPSFDAFSKTQQFAIAKEKQELSNLQEELKRALMTPEELETYEEEQAAKKVEAKAPDPDEVKTVNDAFKYLGIQPKEAALIIDALGKTGTKIDLNFKSDLSGQAAEDLLTIIHNYPVKSEEQAARMDEFRTTHPLVNADTIAEAKKAKEEEDFQRLKKGKTAKAYVDSLLTGADTSSPEVYQRLLDVAKRGNDAVAKEIDKRIATDPNLAAQRKAAEEAAAPAPLAADSPVAPTAESVELTEDELSKLAFESKKSKTAVDKYVGGVAPIFRLSPADAYARLFQLRADVVRLDPGNKDLLLAAIDARLKTPKIAKWLAAKIAAAGEEASIPNRAWMQAGEEATESGDQYGLGTIWEKLTPEGIEQEDAKRALAESHLEAISDPEFNALLETEKKNKAFRLAQTAAQQRRGEEQARTAQEKEYLQDFETQQSIADQSQEAYDELRQSGAALNEAAKAQRQERSRDWLEAYEGDIEPGWEQRLNDNLQIPPEQRQQRLEQNRARLEASLPEFRERRMRRLRSLAGTLKSLSRQEKEVIEKLKNELPSFEQFVAMPDLAPVYANYKVSSYEELSDEQKRELHDAIYAPIENQLVNAAASKLQELRGKKEAVKRELPNGKEIVYSKKSPPPQTGFAQFLTAAISDFTAKKAAEASAAKPKAPAKSKQQAAQKPQAEQPVAQKPQAEQQRIKAEVLFDEPFTAEEIAEYISRSDTLDDLDNLYDVVIDSFHLTETEKENLLYLLNERTIAALIDKQIIVTNNAFKFIKEIGAKNIYGRALLRAYVPQVEEVARLSVPPSKRATVPNQPKAKSVSEPSKPSITPSDLKNAVVDIPAIARERAQKPRVLDMDSLSDLQYAEFQDTAKKAKNHYEAIRIYFGRERALKALAADMSAARIEESKKEGLSDETIKAGKAGTKPTHFGAAGGLGRATAKSKIAADEEGVSDRYTQAYVPFTGGEYGKAFFDGLSDQDRAYVIKQLITYRSMALRYENIVRPYLDTMSQREKGKAQKEAIRQGWMDAFGIDKLLKEIESSQVLSSDTDYGAQLKGDLVTKALWYAQNTVGKLIDSYDYTFNPTSPSMVNIAKLRNSILAAGASDKDRGIATQHLAKLTKELNDKRISIYKDLRAAYQGFIKFVRNHPETSAQYQAKRTQAAISEVISERGIPAGLTSTSVNDLKEDIKHVMRRSDALDSKIKVFANPAESGLKDIPNDVRGLVIRDPKDINDFEVYLFADNIPEGQGVGVFLHELGGHIGLRKLVGEANYTFLINSVKQWATTPGNKIENVVARSVSDKVAALQANGELDAADANEELLAYFIEEAFARGVRPSELEGGPLYIFFKKILAGIANILNKLNLGVKNLSAQDIVDLAYGAAHIELEKARDERARTAEPESEIEREAALAKRDIDDRFGINPYSSDFASPRISYGETEDADIAAVKQRAKDAAAARTNRRTRKVVSKGQLRAQTAASLAKYYGDESFLRAPEQDGYTPRADEKEEDAARVSASQQAYARQQARAKERQEERYRKYGIPPELVSMPFQIEDDLLRAYRRLAPSQRAVAERLIKDRLGLQEEASVRELTGEDIEDSTLSTAVKSDFRDYDELLDDAGGEEAFSAADIEDQLNQIAELLMANEPIGKAKAIILAVRRADEAESKSGLSADETGYSYPIFEKKEIRLDTKKQIRGFFDKLTKRGLLDDAYTGALEDTLSDRDMEAEDALNDLEEVIDEAYDLRLKEISDDLRGRIEGETSKEAAREILREHVGEETLKEIMFSRPTPPTVSPQIASNSPVVNALTFGRMQTTATRARPWNNATIQNLKNGLSVLRPAATSRMFSLLSNREFASYIEKENKDLATAVRKVDDAYGLQVAKEAKDRQQISKNLTKWDAIYKKFTAAQKADFEEVFHESTRLQVKVEDPAFANDPLAIRFKRFSPEAKQMYRDIFASYRDFRDKYIDLLDKLTDGDLSTTMKLTYDAMRKGLDPYAPLQRYGDYWLTYIDKDKEPVPMAFRNPGERDDFIKVLLANGIKKSDISSYMRLEEINTNTVPPTAAFARIMQSMKKNGASSELINDVYRTYLSTLPSASIRQQFQRRKAYKGYEGDSLRVYADVATKMAHQLAHMEFVKTADLQDLAAREAVKKTPSDFNAMAYQSFAERTTFLRSPMRDDFASKAGRFSYMYFILNNVSSALMNTLALPTIVQGMLGGPYGHANAVREISRAMKMVFKGGYDDNSNLRSVFTGRNLSDISFYGNKARKNKQFEAEYADLYNAAVNRTSIRRSTGQEIVSRKSTSISDYTGTRVRIEGSLNWVFQNSERFVREVSLLAAYHLALKSGATKKQAIQKALDFVELVNGAATTGQGAPVFQGAVGRFVGIFKKYPAAMMHLQCKLFYEAFKDADPKVRAIARKQLLSIFGMTYLFCGVKGMPMVGMGTMMASILNFMFGDDDEPFDADFALLEAVNSLNYYGPVGTALNTDFGRAGLTNMFFRSDPERFEKVGAVPYLLETIGGAPVSIALGIERGVNHFIDGNYMKGFQAVSPSFVRNVLKSFEMMNKGLVNSRGEVLMETSGMDAFKNFFGVTPLDVRKTYETNTFTYREDKRLNDRYQYFFDRYNLALDSEDIDDQLEVEEERLAWNEKHPEAQVTMDKLRESRRKHLSNLEEAVNGVRTSPNFRERLDTKYGPYRPE